MMDNITATYLRVGDLRAVLTPRERNLPFGGKRQHSFANPFIRPDDGPPEE